MTRVSPHEFERMSFLRPRTCRRCYLHRADHPTKAEVVARPLGDRRKPLRFSA